MKKLPVGMERFVVKKIDKLYRVYDKARGSFPVTGAEWGGSVQQDVPEDVAQAEADRLNQVKQVKPEEKSSDKSIQLEDVAELPVKEEDIADYGEMTDEERAAYEDGLLEKVTY